MVYLERFDLLAEIGGVSADMDYIANPQRTALELDGRDGEVAVIVSHDAGGLRVDALTAALLRFALVFPVAFFALPLQPP